MQAANRHYKCSKISEVKFQYLLRLFALYLTAADTVRLTGPSVRAVNDLYLRLRRRLRARCPVPAGLDGAVELDERSFGPRRAGSLSGLGRAVAELGRVEKTLYLLAYVQDEAYRRRILV